MTEPEQADVCKHCGVALTADRPYPRHAAGSYRGKNRCGSESALPYGYNACRVGEPCDPTCLGAS